MTASSQKTTSTQTVIGILLRELRYERNIHEATVADLLNVSCRTYQKFESGHKSMEVSRLLNVLYFLMIPPSMFWGAFERYCVILSAWGWKVSPNLVIEDDKLLRVIQQFYHTTPSERPHCSIMNSPHYNKNPSIAPKLPSVFEYIRDNHHNS